MEDKEKKLIQELERNFVEKALHHVVFMEKCRYSKPNVKLNDIDYQFLVGVAQGRTRREFDLALKTFGVTYAQMERRMKMLFEAITLTHVVYKAMQMGILK